MEQRKILVFVNYLYYFADYRVWVLEPRVQQQYMVYLSILNRNFSADLSSHSSLSFRREAKGVQNLVSWVCLLSLQDSNRQSDTDRGS